MVSFPSSNHQMCSRVLYFLEFMMAVWRAACKQKFIISGDRTDAQTRVEAVRVENVGDSTDFA